jgi:hypothetical protein
MDGALDLLGPTPLARDGRITRMFRAANVDDRGAARHLRRLPYGRIANREEFWRVLSERRGTCITKHALLAELCGEQGIEVQLTLGHLRDGGAEHPLRGAGAELLRARVHPRGPLLPPLPGRAHRRRRRPPPAPRSSSGSSTKSPSPSGRSARTRSGSTSGSSRVGLLLLQFLAERGDLLAHRAWCRSERPRETPP